MPSDPLVRQAPPRSVADVPMHEVPWSWGFLAALVLPLAGLAVIRETEVNFRPSATLTDGERIDLNYGSLEELESLSGIGPVLARAIISARPFSSVEDLTRVRGIGESLVQSLKSQIQAAQGRRAVDLGAGE